MSGRAWMGFGLWVAAVGCSPASTPHDRCYFISSGPHAKIACLECHSSFTGVDAGSFPGTCDTGTAHCTGCHAHPCNGPTATMATATDLLHRPPKTAAPVTGYACGDRKCYQCHREAAP